MGGDRMSEFKVRDIVKYRHDDGKEYRAQIIKINHDGMLELDMMPEIPSLLRYEDDPLILRHIVAHPNTCIKE